MPFRKAPWSEYQPYKASASRILTPGAGPTGVNMLIIKQSWFGSVTASLLHQSGDCALAPANKKQPAFSSMAMSLPAPRRLGENVINPATSNYPSDSKLVSVAPCIWQLSGIAVSAQSSIVLGISLATMLGD